MPHLRFRYDTPINACELIIDIIDRFHCYRNWIPCPLQLHPDTWTDRSRGWCGREVAETEEPLYLVSIFRTAERIRWERALCPVRTHSDTIWAVEISMIMIRPYRATTRSVRFFFDKYKYMFRSVLNIPTLFSCPSWASKRIRTNL